MYKVILTVLVIAILIVGYIVFKDVEFVSGEANVESAYDAITQVQDSVKDTAAAVADTIGREGGSEYEAPEGLASKLWTWAEALKDLLD